MVVAKTIIELWSYGDNDDDNHNEIIFNDIT